MELGDVGTAPLELSADHRQDTLILRNVTQPSVPTLFKVQCTAPRKLRVRPALGVLAASGDVVSLQVQLNPQECSPATCKLLIVGRHTPAAATDANQLKSLWTAAEANDAQTLVLSETVTVKISANDDKRMTLPDLPTTSELTTTQLSGLVLLLMKSQSRRKENKLTTDEQEELEVARVLHVSAWSRLEEYAFRMRKLLRERNKRKTQTT
ncbi:hypothetical protein P3T76_010582 [Phytophthora citrophthora]|uniref:MSP domain-containing protein n=1 Tax=Phytophthora citrophthora TaxID=4793 RepID=A0AAD9GBN7_9STRA|nr:hypothetical protein P3T76_010582 [Phytophthora citrophthora]